MSGTGTLATGKFPGSLDSNRASALVAVNASVLVDACGRRLFTTREPPFFGRVRLTATGIGAVVSS
jgi:hypothetical protein